jgi:hypothetical protein
MCFSQDRELGVATEITRRFPPHVFQSRQGVGSSQNHFAEEDRNRNLNQQRIIRFTNGLKMCTEVE